MPRTKKSAVDEEEEIFDEPSTKKTPKKKRSKSPKSKKPKSPKRKRSKSPTKSRSKSPKSKKSKSPKKRSRSPDSYTKTGGAQPKKASLKKLIKYYFNVRVSNSALIKYGAFSYKLLESMAQHAVSMMHTAKKKTLLFEHALHAVRMLGIDETADQQMKNTEFKSCGRNAPKAKSVKSKVQSEHKKLSKGGPINLDSVLGSMKFAIGGNCVHLQKKSFKTMLLTIIKERNLAPITGNDKIKLSKPGLTLLQVVFERQLLIVISGSVAVAAAAKRAGPKKEDVSVADFIGQLNKRSKKDK